MSEAIRQGELVGKGLMAYETTEEVGCVEHLLIDVKRSQTIALAYKAPGLIARKQSISWQNIVKIGGDRILVHTQPFADEPELTAAQNMTGLEVWTDGGDRIGTLVDLRIDRATGKVEEYLFALEHEQTQTIAFDAEPAAGHGPESDAISVYAIDPKMIISAGRKRMMIAEADAQRSQAKGERIEIVSLQPLSDRSTPALPTEIPADFGRLFQQGKTFAEKATQQARERAKQFADERLANQDLLEADSLPDITQQLQAKTEQAKQQIQQQLGRAAEKAEKAKAQIDGQLGKSSFGRSLGSSFSQAIDKLKRPSDSSADPIDVDAFEVWEDD